MFAITVQSLKTGIQYEMTCGLRIPEKTILTDDYDQYKVLETTIVVPEPFYDEEKVIKTINNAIKDAFGLVQIEEEDEDDY